MFFMLYLQSCSCHAWHMRYNNSCQFPRVVCDWQKTLCYTKNLPFSTLITNESYVVAKFLFLNAPSGLVFCKWIFFFFNPCHLNVSRLWLLFTLITNVQVPSITEKQYKSARKDFVKFCFNFKRTAPHTWCMHVCKILMNLKAKV